jgi:hypothetical protein
VGTDRVTRVKSRNVVYLAGMVGGSGRGESEHLLSVFFFASLLEERRERVERQVAAADEPFVVLLNHDARGEAGAP